MMTPHSARRMGKSSASDSAAQIVVGVAMVSRKIRTGEPQNLLDFRASPSLRQQVSGNPQIHDAPVGLRKALEDAPSIHTGPVDFGGHDARMWVGAESWNVEWGPLSWARSGETSAVADCSSASARGAKPNLAPMTFTQGA